MTLSNARMSAIGAVRLYGPRISALFARRTGLKVAVLSLAAACAAAFAVLDTTPKEIRLDNTMTGWAARA